MQLPYPRSTKGLDVSLSVLGVCVYVFMCVHNVWVLALVLV